MEITDQIEQLLEEKAWVIDILPVQVPAERNRQYAMLEEYYGTAGQTEAFARKLCSVLTKLYCYHDLLLYWPDDESQIEEPKMTDIAAAVRRCLLSAEKRDAVLDILVMGEKPALVMLCRQDLYMSVYGPDEQLRQLLERLASAEGLFVRPAAL